MNSTRLKFELIDPQTSDRPVSPLAQLSSRLRREEQPQRSQTSPRLVQDLAQGLDFLIAQLAEAEMDRDRARAQADRWKSETSKMRTEIADLQRDVKAAREGNGEVHATRQTLESVIAEQQKALLLSMELMHRFEGEIASLRGRVDTMESAPAPTAIPNDALRELEALRLESARTSLEESVATQNASALNSKLDSALQESAKLREELAERTRLGDPTAAIRALEEQRDIARNDAASARADVSIQSAEIETKDALINALERALEQQHGSLRSLEQRFAEYATRLQELRLDRLRMPEGDPSPTTEASGVRRLLEGFKRTFSPVAKPDIEPNEDSVQ